MSRYRLIQKADVDGINWIYPQKRIGFFWVNIEYGNWIGGMRFWGDIGNTKEGEWDKAERFVERMKKGENQNRRSKIVYL